MFVNNGLLQNCMGLVSANNGLLQNCMGLVFANNGLLQNCMGLVSANNSLLQNCIGLMFAYDDNVENLEKALRRSLVGAFASNAPLQGENTIRTGSHFLLWQMSPSSPSIRKRPRKCVLRKES